jgi:hypothetical protein
MTILLGAALGLLIAFILAVPAIILDTSRRVKNLPLLIDVYIWRGKKMNDGEVFAIGLAVHLIVGGLYGLLYTLFATNDWLVITNQPFSILSMLIFAAICWFVLMVMIFPIIGFGFFARKEGKTAWVESLISLLLEGGILWMVIQYYQPFFF